MGVRQPQTPASKITNEVGVADQKKDNECGVCMVCYEDLKPLTENLQVITTCGHVFHQHCLLQWLEYSVANNRTCPVCRQTCRRENVRRLYFQSDGDSTDHSQNLPDTEGTEEDEVKKLQGKLLGLTSSFEHQLQQLKDMSEELNKLNDMNKELTKCNEEKNKELNKLKDMNKELTRYNEAKNKDIVFYKALLKLFFLVTCCSMVYSIMM
ncbi:hypothetical protein MKX03_014626 [Papaver bracteatum]|nr:hypothetical protein MKX03_014626 [Papaver bracteatum]